MSKISTDERFKRVMKFLMASSEATIADLLARRGFSDEDRAEGWALLDKAAGRHLAITPGSGTFSTQYNKVIEQLDEWENMWFDVADAALGRKFPVAREMLFKNLSKTSGQEVVITVKTFTGRLTELENSGDEGKAAVALLEKRGLNKERRNEASGLLAKLAAEPVATAPVVDDTALKAEQEAAAALMWEWFKDWSKTARTVVKNRNYHVMMGLIAPHGGSDQGTVDEVEAAEK